MKRSLLFLMIITLTLITNGQQNDLEKVFINNGNIIRDTIIEQVLNNSVRIASTVIDSMNINLDKKEKHIEEQIPDTNKKSDVRRWSSKGYHLIIEACFASKVNKYSMDFRTLSIFNDIRFDRNFALGIGIALRHNINPTYHITYPNYEHVMISVFCDLRTYFLISRKISGYSAFDIGYYFSSKYMSSNLCGLNYNGRGLLLNPSSGLVFIICAKSALNIGIGYEMYKVGYDLSYYNGHPFVQVCGEKITGSVGIKAGITF